MSQIAEEEKDKEASASVSGSHPSMSGTSQAFDFPTVSNTIPETNEASASAFPVVSHVAPSPRRTSPRRSPAKLRKTPSQQSLASTASTAPAFQLNKRTSMSSLRGATPQTPPRSPVSSGRRSSASLLSGSYIKPASPKEIPRLVWTPSSIAKEYFRKDLSSHASIEPTQSPNVAVIFHDACYGHRFSRPRTSKANLGTIVERPERILAIASGVSAAYVLLGDRHSAGANAPHPTLSASAVPFIISKSSRNVDITSPAVANVHGLKWMTELKEMCNSAEAKLTQNGKELGRPHDPSGANKDKPRLHEGDLYLCAESLAAFEGALGGVLDAVDTAFKANGPNRVFACVRPPGHHCSDDYPSGFCWLNNVHVGISHAALEHGLTHAAIFDFDLHHGDGSQSITWAQNTRAQSLPKNASLSRKTSIGYYSLHDINSYPCEWGDEDKVRNASLCIENAHGQSIWNVHLQPWKSYDEFWKLYEERYSVLINKMRDYLKTQNERFRNMSAAVRPKAAIFISAGFDASEWEGHGMQRHAVNVPTEFYARVTQDIVKLSEEEGLGVDGRVISVLEGGYSDRALASGVLSHLCGLTSLPASRSSLSSKLENGTLTSFPVRYQEEWWSPVRLEELERHTKDTTSQAPPTKARQGTTPSYHSPTQSFNAKVVSQPTYQRSVANSVSRHTSGAYERPRTPTPPPPEVDWAVASYEVCQLIVPQDRQTRSCRPEDLNAKATEARKSRQSTIGLPVPSETEDPLEKGLEKMSLKDKQTKAPIPSADETRTSSRAAANRRKTYGGVEILEKAIPKQPSRRLSTASANVSITEDALPKPAPLPTDPAPATKVRAAPKPRVPKKTTSKPPVPRATASLKRNTSEQSANNVGEAQSNGDGTIDDLVSGMKNIRLKLNAPAKVGGNAKVGDPPAVTKETKKAVRAPRKAPVKKPTSKDTVQPATTKPTVPEAGPAASSIKLSQPQTLDNQAANSMPDTKLPSTIGASALQSQAIGQQTAQYSNPQIDNMMFKQTPFDQTLADYLAPTDTPSISSPEVPQQSTIHPTTIATYNHNPSSSFSTPQATQIPQTQPHTQHPVYASPSQSTKPRTPAQTPNYKSNVKSLPTFGSHGPIPFAAASNSARQSPSQQSYIAPGYQQTARQEQSDPGIKHENPVAPLQPPANSTAEVDNGFGPDHGYDYTLIKNETEIGDKDLSMDFEMDMSIQK